MEFAEKFEMGAARLLAQELADVDDDDDVRTCLIVTTIIERIEQSDYVPQVPGVDREEALRLLRGMVARRITAGELRRNVAAAMGQVMAGG